MGVNFLDKWRTKHPAKSNFLKRKIHKIRSKSKKNSPQRFVISNKLRTFATL